MTYENDIPDYALQPARAPKVTEAEAIYNTEKIIYPSAEQTVIYQFEEDILVPDTKPDMQEILIMDATADIMPSEKKVSPKTDDLLNITGTISIQTIYNPEGEGTDIVSIASKVPYKYQWSLNPADQAEGVFGCNVKKLEYMVINERKFRVKITLEFSGQLFCERDFSFFEGLKDEKLEMKRKTTEMTCLELVKKDEVTIDESFKGKDTAARPEYILKQNFVITENYRQVTTEKVVINGFVFCSLLYSASDPSEEEAKPIICQHNQRIEFTQFVPIEKDYRGKKWSTVKTDFCPKDLVVTLESDEDNPDEVIFRIHGDINTRVEMFGSREIDMTVDAYHRDKNFQFDLVKKKVENLSDTATAETSIREIINLSEGAKASEAIFCEAKIVDCKSTCERGKIMISGVASCSALWRDHNGNCHAEKIIPDFRGTVDMDKAMASQKSYCRPVIKTAWVDVINEKQIEINCTIMLNVETSDEKEVSLLEKPCFVDRPREKEYPMVIATIKEGETLWQLAKRYKTTEAHIKTANSLDDEPECGKRLLIVK